jgi:hypothetical protein
MSPRKSDQNTKADSVQSIKADILSLAHELWTEQRNAATGVDWLVDGRLTIQLDELSMSELLRVKLLLVKSARKTRSNRKYMTGSPI